MIAVLRTLRPEQWTKNGMVFLGLLFGNHLFNGVLLFQICCVFIAFCFLSSSVYIFNDIQDREQDRQHPTKKLRPIAASEIAPKLAIALSITLCLLSLLTGYLISYRLLLIFISYLALNILYTLKLKQIVLVDVFCISFGFMLRVFAGTLAVGIPPSKWLVICSMMLTLFLGFSKRRAEILSLMNNPESGRGVLKNYATPFLDEISAISAAGVILTYSLYTMSPETYLTHHTENLIYTVPFVTYGLFRYLYIVHHAQKGEDPSRELFKDKHLLLSINLWALFTLFILLRASGVIRFI